MILFEPILMFGPKNLGGTLWNIGDSDNWQGTAAAATLYAPTIYAKKSAYVNFYRGLNE
jgi:hypothetical protein